MNRHHGNPSSVHAPGRQARNAVEQARNTIAGVLDVDADTIVFTSGGTESDNMALQSITGKRNPSIATSPVEHDAVVRTARFLESKGYSLHWLDVASDGAVQFDSIEKALDADVDLVSVMHVNNEVGTLNDVEHIGDMCHSNGVLFHTDAVQSAGLFDLANACKHADYVSVSAHKIGGPKGTGLLYARAGAPLESLLHGGLQERERRAGTENVAAIVGFAEALKIAQAERETAFESVQACRNALLNGLQNRLGDTIRIMTPRRSAPHILNIIALERDGIGLDGEMLVLGLDVEGLCVSTGSACSSGTVKPSRALTSMGIQKEEARGAIRFSLAPSTSRSDVDRAVDIASTVIGRMTFS